MGLAHKIFYLSKIFFSEKAGKHYLRIVSFFHATYGSILADPWVGGLIQ